MTSRPLHAVQYPASAGERMLGALAAALDGSGPAILPLDPALDGRPLSAVLAALAPAAITTLSGTQPLRAVRGLPDAAAVPDDVAVVIATSGSTGTPKGVQLSAAALTAAAAASLRRIGAGPADRWLCCLPTFHVSGLGVLVRSLLAGTDPVISPSVDARVLAAAGCQHVSLVPTQLRRLLAAGCPARLVDTVLLGGAAAGEPLLAQARAAGWPVVSSYGMSETCGGCVYDGMPLDGVSVMAGQDGRLRIAGPVLFSGYRLQPGLTAAAMTDGWFLTADIGSVSDEGRVEILGRADDVINSGGEKIVPGEVEAVLGTSAGVADVVVVGVPDPDWGQTVTAVVVAADPAYPPELAALRSDVRAALSARAAPKRMIIVPAIPLLASGKPDMVAVRLIAAR